MQKLESSPKNLVYTKGRLNFIMLPTILKYTICLLKKYNYELSAFLSKYTKLSNDYHFFSL